MKRYVFSLIGLAMLGGSVLGQTPTPTPAPHGHGGAPVVAPVVVATEGVGCAAPKTICVPECTVKKHTTVTYSSVCEPFCLCRPSGLGLFHNKDCANGNCSEPITRRYLVKKVRVCDEPTTKCVPVTAPGCVAAIAPPTGHVIPGVPLPPGTTLVPPMPPVSPSPSPAVPAVYSMPQGMPTPTASTPGAPAPPLLIQ